jgi:uncharacterized delta-60 repeat protein
MSRRRAQLLLCLLLGSSLAGTACVRAGFDVEGGADGAPAVDGLSTRETGHDGPASCPTGSLDTTFGGKGYVLLPVNKTQIDQAKEVMVDAGGRIVVAGQRWTSATGNDFFVARYLASGALDTSFDGEGFTTVGDAQSNTLFGMDIDRKHRIVVGGASYKGAARNELTLARLGADGELDPGFGAGGIAVLPHGPLEDRVTDVVVDSKDRIVFAGWTEHSADNRRYLAGRVTEAGVLDKTFNDTGFVDAAFPGEPGSAWSVALDTAGRIVVGGLIWSLPNNTKNDVGVVRLTADGVPDAAFGTGGEAQEDVLNGSDDLFRDLALGSDGSVFVTGYTAGAARRLFVLKLRSDGSRDTAFGEGGAYLLDAALDARGFSISLDASRQIVAVGDAKGASNRDVIVVRLREDGSPDTSLGGTGRVLIDLGRDENVRESTIDATGRLLVTGWQNDDPTTDSFLLRLCLLESP